MTESDPYPDGIEVTFTDAPPLDHPDANYPGFEPSETVLEEGYVHEKGAKPLPCDVLRQRDVGVELRDGTTIYVDIFRPPEATDAPVIVGWSPYGKGDTGFDILGEVPGRMGISRGQLSGLEAFEAPDPAYWCDHGYAVVQPDVRGAFNSEGDRRWWGTGEGQDGHDLIEWLGARDWSNGNVGLTGNSWLAIAQWFVAAEQPSRLAAIAPWEGLTDLYRDNLRPGGIPEPNFGAAIRDLLFGENRIEDPNAMLEGNPLMNEYWADKIPDFERIEVPAYVVASYTNDIHTTPAGGTFRGFEELPVEEKWLRVHNSHEWPDYYDDEHVEDLRRFFDRYLKGIDNNWEDTPRVRLSVLDNGGDDVVGRAEERFPPSRVEPVALHLDAGTGRLVDDPLERETSVRYDAENGGRATFTYQFEEDAELLGYSKLRLWVEAPDHDDADVHVTLQKLDTSGNLRYHQMASAPFPLGDTILPVVYRLGRERFDQLEPLDNNFFWDGPEGQLRASHRETDDERSTETRPHYEHTRRQPLNPGEVVSIDIGIEPTGMRFHAGERLRVVVDGEPTNPHLPDVPPNENHNRGDHVIHAGGEYDSRLVVPLTTI